jgi:hypothetical protein
VTSIGFHGNIVSVWERFVKEFEATGELLVDLGSDQGIICKLLTFFKTENIPY